MTFRKKLFSHFQHSRPPNNSNMSQQHMLSEKQLRAVVLNVNKDIDIPFIREQHEEELMTNFARNINEHLEPAFHSVIGPVFTRCIKLALCQEMSVEERRHEITTLVRGELSEPVSVVLNEHVQLRGIPDGLEHSVLKMVVDKMIKQLVNWTISELDEKVNESLRELGAEP